MKAFKMSENRFRFFTAIVTTGRICVIDSGSDVVKYRNIYSWQT